MRNEMEAAQLKLEADGFDGVYLGREIRNVHRLRFMVRQHTGVRVL
jgi:hypothetical protein